MRLVREFTNAFVIIQTLSDKSHYCLYKCNKLNLCKFHSIFRFETFVLSCPEGFTVVSNQNFFLKNWPSSQAKQKSKECNLYSNSLEIFRVFIHPSELGKKEPRKTLSFHNSVFGLAGFPIVRKY